MNKIFIFFLILISPTVQCQEIGKDSLESLFHKSTYLLLSHDEPAEAAEYLTKIIDIDSTYFKIYLFRAICYLKDAESKVVDSNNIIIHDFNDSSLISKAIRDIDKTITMYQKERKLFPSSFSWSPDSTFHIEEIRQLGAFNLQNEDLINGTRFYLNGKYSNSNAACKCWKRLKGIHEANILIKKYCK